MEKAIQKSREGGYKIDDFSLAIMSRSYLIDPLFWKALGKAMGWGKERPKDEWYCPALYEGQPCICPPKNKKNIDHFYSTHDSDWLSHWHRFIDKIASGGTPDEFFEELLETDGK